MNILDYLKNNILYLDGGMGTLLQKSGLKPGEHPEVWNITNPQTIQNIHRDYFDAGSNVVNTNTFGANSLKFTDDELESIIKSAIENARIARDTSKGTQEKFIALDLGPTGKLLKPYGDFEFEDAVNVFKKTVGMGVKFGVDLVFIETMNDSYETKAALLAVKEMCDLPVFVSNAYGEDGKLMTGASPEAMVCMLEGMGADAIGLNCSLGPRELGSIAEKMLAVASVPVIMKPNAGLPKSVDGKTVYDVDSDEFADALKMMIDKGVRIAGGCCGTTPEYIKSLVDKVKAQERFEASADGIKVENRPDIIWEDALKGYKDITMVSSYTHAVVFDKSPVLIGERINPTGKKRFKQALIEGDMDYVLTEGIRQQEKGVHILDVNVGIPDIDEEKVLSDTVFNLQAVSDLPLQIDTSNPKAMEKALRLYNGKAMINSVNGKKESMHAIFPLVKKYGGVVVALTLDENGIPDTIEGRVAIARKILDTAKVYGIDKKDIVFDTLAMAVSADKDACKVTLGALEVIKNELGCHTSLGVSNVSFGLPSRDAINSVYFASALERGLSAAIMNPHSDQMMQTYYSYMALNGFDENFAEYITFMEGMKPENKPTEIVSGDAHGALKNAIIKGLKDKAGVICDELLKENAPLEIVNGDIIPALDIVGRGFEEKTVYLPQLLMSAEGAKCAFERIKEHMSGSKLDNTKKCTFVIATVHGDIHDIGKNIVKLILENYGFNVIDLGKDVPPEVIADKVAETRAPLVGLSALMTTTVPYMEETIKLLRERAPWCKVIVGGAVLTKEYADTIGADMYAKDAMEAVRYADTING